MDFVGSCFRRGDWQGRKGEAFCGAGDRFNPSIKPYLYTAVQHVFHRAVYRKTIILKWLTAKDGGAGLDEQTHPKAKEFLDSFGRMFHKCPYI